jgi:hypothetical protein
MPSLPPPAPAPLPSQRADILDPATTTSLRDMKIRVLLLHLDTSGYGATIFNDWRRIFGPDDRTAGVTHVLMNVLSVRASRELIDVRTVMGPFAVVATKTTEIRRLNSVLVVLHESDWEPASDGHYFYPNTSIITHPGTIKGVNNVRNFTDVGRGTSRTIPEIQRHGCVFLKGESGEDLSDPDGLRWYMSTLEQLNLGGRIDNIVQIGTYGLDLCETLAG